MRIKKMYQGGLPENKILNIQSESSTDTYSCDYINNLNFSVDELDELPVDSIVEYAGTDVPDGWELVEETNIGKSLISISGGGEKTYTIGAWVWTPLEFDAIIHNLGDGFEYDTETYEIKVLKDMTVKVDAQISYFGTATGEMNVRILKNNDATNGTIAYANEYTGHTDKSGTLNIVSAITNVVVDDVIQIQFSGVAGSYSINQRDFLTHMTVEEISNPVISINGVESIETKEKNYIQCGFTENFWVPDINYKLLTFDNIKIGGEVFSYDNETNEVVINESYNINNVKLHFHTMLTTGGDLAVEAIEVLVYKNDAIAVIINDGLDNKSSRSATSLDYVVDCAPGDRFRVEARSYSNTYQMLATYGRTAFTIEEVVDNNIGDVIVEEKQPSAITAVYDPAVAGTSGNWTLPETNVSTDYPINSVVSQTGTGLTLDAENNCITVGKGISTVLVFTKITYVTNQSGSDKTWATYITKNKANYSQATFTPTVGVHNNINNSVILNVEEGDQIRMPFYGQAGDLVGRVTNTNISVVELTNNITVSEDNSNSEWKLLQANVPAKTTVDISSLDFNELYIEARVGTQTEANANFIQTFHILKASLSDELKYYRHGAYFYASYNGASVIQATLTSIMSTDNYFNGNVVNDYTFVDIYYK